VIDIQISNQLFGGGQAENGGAKATATHFSLHSWEMSELNESNRNLKK